MAIALNFLRIAHFQIRSPVDVIVSILLLMLAGCLRVKHAPEPKRLEPA